MILAAKAAAVVAVAGIASAGGGMTIAHLAHEVKTLQHQVYVLNRSADAYGLQFGTSGKQLVCLRVQAPNFGRNYGILPAYRCVPSP